MYEACNRYKLQVNSTALEQRAANQRSISSQIKAENN